ncbi:NAD-dependent protein deacylase sirtuin-5, mitochondrial [Emticicia aquatica]|uniref:protein acetyllysine N-acetyltransferase n=1 Tax=Emticicia aquatica TaxID=1681835 RepID=A0ABM9AMN4_9BACT|nr:NAD-dependent deacylase [Emticicia aquatica]CAH0995054.1 NAD-dependent protein deacylase sirtuin-5, mitochondrial [Emticicia aquatica]
MKKKLVVLTGAGVSAESGLKTFRDTGGLWENYSIEDVATPEGWQKNPVLVLQFYNDRRKTAFEAHPNQGHLALVDLEKYFDVQIITQNVDNLHEKAGSTNVLHLHGELTKVRSVKNQNLIYDIGEKSIQIGDLAEDGGQLRPHIVWFGEMVPMIEVATDICANADIFVVIGTSMQVYPAAGLIGFVSKNVPKFIIDPSIPDVSKQYKKINFINETATIGVPQLAEILIKNYQ